METVKGLFVVFVLAMVGAAVALGGCESADRAAAARAQAQANEIRARSEAATERAVQERESSRLAHQQALELVPVVLMVGGGVVLLVVVGLIFWDIRTRTLMMYEMEVRRLEALRAARQIQLPDGRVVDGRAAYWREVERLASGEQARLETAEWRE